MIVHRSNRTEELISELAGVVGAPGLGAFSKEVLVVQGRGMERWLCMQLADRLGIWANPDVLKPRGFLELVFKRVLESEITPAYDSESLLWSIADLLPDLVANDEFASIRRYLAKDDDGRRRIQLSHQIAITFDEYMAHRPEMMLKWLNADRTEFDDRDEPWQAMLWRALTKRLGGNHLAGRAGALLDRLNRGVLPEGCLPQRVSIFGVSSLPRLYLDLYTALSEHLELHLFVLSPTREYWADIATPHEVRRELRRDHDQDEVSLHLDEAPSLLASLGRLGRDFHRMIEEDGSYAETSGDLYREPLDDGSSMLAVLQSDILNLRGAQDDATLRRSIDDGDRSVRVHSCHGPMREVEVLCEELMSSFEADPTLEPQDIIVMTPSVRTYAPYIEAVFGTRTNKGTSVRDGEGAIPYRIADRWPQPGDQIVDAFARGLDFVGGRFGVSDALDLLDIDCIRERFEFEPADLPVVRAWIVEAGVRWGVDAEHREANDVPGNRANTWQFGLDRLLLGYALEDDHHSVFQGERPVAGVEGQNAEVLGRVLAFIHFLSAQREALAAPRSLQAWREALLDFLAGLVVYGDETQEQHQTIRSALDKLMAHGAEANFEGDVSLTSVREQLDRNLELAHAASGFLTGGVTFCELVPMRSIPFRVVCLLGMNDDEFPRIRHALGFDLIAKKRRVGDRTAREDDRYLFLEAILSARQQLIISFVGQSIKDGAELPPSAVVSELLDTLNETFELAGTGERDVRDAMVLTHPLQPYSGRYFSRSGTLDFEVHSARYCEAANLLASPREKESLFLDRAIESRPIPAEEVKLVELEDLLNFFQHPARNFLRRTLQISLHGDRDPLAQREPFDLDGLEAFRIGGELLSLVRAGIKASDAQAIIRSSGRLPHGTVGHVVFSDLANEVEQLAEKANQFASGETTASISFALLFGDVHVRGGLTDVMPHGQVFCRFSKLGRRAELGAWLRHLVLQVAREEATAVADRANRARLAEASPETYVVGRPVKAGGATVVRFNEVESPRDELEKLLHLYQAGMRAPLPFFPNASRDFAQQRLKGGSTTDALVVARKSYYESFSIQGEGSDENNILAFRGVDPLDPDATLACGLGFAEVSEQVFLPLLAAREELE